MSTARTCPRCGTSLADGTTDDLCPRCLLACGLASSVTNDPSARPDAPTLAGKTLPPQPAAGAKRSGGATIHYFGDYELLDKIAEGGMGVVWRARQVSLNRVVAVKMIRAGRFASLDEVKRFHTEAEAAANLQHPNIVAIHEVGEHDGQHYFSMDYVEGRNLAELAREGALPPARAAALVKIIAEAIHFAHQRGTLHRDLKPSNVLLDSAGQPRITDFGLAKLTTRDSGLTQTGAVMGTPAYMPPEQAAGRRAEFGPASDVYSLGAMLYELLTGQAPFLGETPVATLRKVLEEASVPPKKHNPLVPPDLETICLKCLEKSPQRRYAAARALAEDLGRFLNHEPIVAQRASQMRKAWSWSRRHPWVISAILSFIVLVVLCLAYGLWEQTQYLAWVIAHPEKVEHMGAFSKSAREFKAYASLINVGLVITAWHLSGRARRRQRAAMRLNPYQVGLLGAFGMVIIFLGMLAAMKAIRANVWENYRLVELQGPAPRLLLICAAVSLVGMWLVRSRIRSTVLNRNAGEPITLTEIRKRMDDGIAGRIGFLLTIATALAMLIAFFAVIEMFPLLPLAYLSLWAGGIIFREAIQEYRCVVQGDSLIRKLLPGEEAYIRRLLSEKKSGAHVAHWDAILAYCMFTKEGTEEAAKFVKELEASPQPSQSDFAPSSQQDALLPAQRLVIGRIRSLWEQGKADGAGEAFRIMIKEGPEQAAKYLNALEASQSASQRNEPRKAGEEDDA